MTKETSSQRHPLVLPAEAVTALKAAREALRTAHREILP
jgi:hypothetical protein